MIKVVSLSAAVKMLKNNEYDVTKVEGHNIIIFHKKTMDATRYVAEIDDNDLNKLW